MVEKKNTIYQDYKLAIIFGGGGLLILLVLIFAIGLPLLNNMNRTSAELKEKKEELTQLNSKLDNLKTLSEKEADLKTQNEKVLSALPADTDVSRLFVQFENIANQNGLNIASVAEAGKVSSTTPSGSLAPVTYTVTGTIRDYGSLKAALAKIETALRVLSVSKVDVSYSGGSLTGTFDVTTYVRGTK